MIITITMRLNRDEDNSLARSHIEEGIS